MGRKRAVILRRALAIAAIMVGALLVLPVQLAAAQASDGPIGTLVGRITIDVDASGTINGKLKTKDGDRVPVTGELTDGSIRLVLHLGEGGSLFGVGSLQGGISAGAVTTDVAVGPEPGDKGDWGIIWGS